MRSVDLLAQLRFYNTPFEVCTGNTIPLRVFDGLTGGQRKGLEG